MTTPYDEVPYANLPFAQTRPDALATVAALHGVDAPDPRTARVLELGCGAGANLLGIAAARPGTVAVGVDLAPTAIAQARADAQAAGLASVRFDVADVRELTAGELGEFDYVIVHGLYAWAGETVREATLAACRSHLTADGLAYVSFTAHPGGHLRRMLREMAEWHVRGTEGLTERAEGARELFAVLDALPAAGMPAFYEGAIAQDVRTLATGPSETLVHDLLGPEYAPVWFAEFAAAAARHDLAHVADALPEASRRPAWPAEIADWVRRASGDDPVAREQYFDILVLRRFRQSVLCRAGREVRADVEPPALRTLLVDRAPAQGSGPVAFDDLGAAAEDLLAAFDRGEVTFHVVAPPGVAVPGERPEVSGLARSQAVAGGLVTTLRNEVVRLTDEPTARLVALLDGTRDRAAIARDFPGPLSGDELEAALVQFGRLGLLLG